MKAILANAVKSSLRVATCLEDAIAVIEQNPDYRIIRRLPEFTPVQNVEQKNMRRGFYVDVETTGLDVNVDEIIEFGGIPFWFTIDGNYVEPMKPLHFYNEPRKTITQEITDLTGITSAMVEGRTLDIPAIELVLETTDLVIAHNAGYDRPIVERYSKKFVDKYWGCSVSQVEWGTATRKLEYLLYTMGYFYEAHNAVADCKAGLFAISQPLGGVAGNTAQGVTSTGLAQILTASRAKSYHVWAVEAPYDAKDELKTRKYYWNPGDDGRSKSWHKEISAPTTEELDELANTEDNYLKELYKRWRKPYKARFQPVTGKDRFTKRG